VRVAAQHAAHWSLSSGEAVHEAAAARAGTGVTSSDDRRTGSMPPVRTALAVVLLAALALVVVALPLQ